MFASIILGIIQGFTEFLPVSSSGHLLLASKLLNYSQDNHSFTVAIHIATTLAVIIYFRKDILNIIKNLFSKSSSKEEKEFSLKIIIATIPVLIIGYLIKDMNWFTEITSNLSLMGSSLIFFSILLYFADKKSLENKSEQKPLTFKDSFLIGISQIIAAIFPGASRSGMTLTTSFLRNISREEATKFIFLISIPVSGLAAAYEIFLGDKLIIDKNFLVGAIAAFISGLFAIHFLLQIVRKYSLKWFVLYRIVLGMVIIVYAFNL